MKKNQKLNPCKAGLALAAFGVLIHLVWSVAIALAPNATQRFINWIFTLHHVQPVHVLLPFSLANAALLLVVVFAIWYVLGFVFATLWNKLA